MKVAFGLKRPRNLAGGVTIVVLVLAAVLTLDGVIASLKRLRDSLCAYESSWRVGGAHAGAGNYRY